MSIAGAVPVAHPRTPVRPVRTTGHRVALGLSLVCHVVIIGCVAFVAPQLREALATGGRPTCDAAHVDLKQALYGTVCGVRVFRVTGRPDGHGDGRGNRDRGIVLTAGQP